MLEGVLGTNDPDQICALLASFGVSCGSCQSDGESYCMPVRMEDVAANELDDTLECAP